MSVLWFAWSGLVSMPASENVDSEAQALTLLPLPAASLCDYYLPTTKTTNDPGSRLPWVRNRRQNNSLGTQSYQERFRWSDSGLRGHKAKYGFRTLTPSSLLHAKRLFNFLVSAASVYNSFARTS